MNLTPTIQSISQKNLIGMSIQMSLADNQTFQLFRKFMPRKKEIPNASNLNVLDLIVYPAGYFSTFNPATYYTKWVLVEVPNFENVPAEMETFVLPAGEYAVFTHPNPEAAAEIFQTIFAEWLPASDFDLDDRPHFDVLKEKNQQRAVDAELEIWIPVKAKSQK